MLACKIHTASLATLYPVEFKVGLWIENKDVACIFVDFLQSRAGAFKSPWADNTAVRSTPFLTDNWGSVPA